MRLRRKKRKPPRMLLTSMGDIAFLLIIFFMIAANFIKEAHVDVDLPESPDIDEIEESQVSVIMDADALVYVQGKEVEWDALRDVLDGELTGKPSDLITLKIDKTLRHEQFARILVILSKTNAQIAWIGDEP
jgi:biopolymer transport protein ExbD